MNETEALGSYSRGEMTAIELRRRLGGATYGEVLEPDRLQGDERGVLLCEETAVLRRIVVRDRERIVELSTLALPRLEARCS